MNRPIQTPAYLTDRREGRAPGAPAARLYRAKHRVHDTPLERAQTHLLQETHDPPRTRGDCVFATRPCPWIRCKYHLAIDVKGRAVRVNYGDDWPEHAPETCALDVADRGPQKLRDIAACMNLCRERVRQIEESALAKLRAALED